MVSDCSGLKMCSGSAVMALFDSVLGCIRLRTSRIVQQCDKRLAVVKEAMRQRRQQIGVGIAGNK